MPGCVIVAGDVVIELLPMVAMRVPVWSTMTPVEVALLKVGDWKATFTGLVKVVGLVLVIANVPAKLGATTLVTITEAETVARLSLAPLLTVRTNVLVTASDPVPTVPLVARAL